MDEHSVAIRKKIVELSPPNIQNCTRPVVVSALNEKGKSLVSSILARARGLSLSLSLCIWMKIFYILCPLSSFELELTFDIIV